MFFQKQCKPEDTVRAFCKCWNKSVATQNSICESVFQNEGVIGRGKKMAE